MRYAVPYRIHTPQPATCMCTATMPPCHHATMPPCHHAAMPSCHLAASAAAPGDAAADAAAAAAALCAATAFKAASLALSCSSASRILAPGRRTLRSEIWTPFCHGNFLCDLGGQRSRDEAAHSGLKAESNGARRRLSPAPKRATVRAGLKGSGRPCAGGPAIGGWAAAWAVRAL